MERRLPLLIAATLLAQLALGVSLGLFYNYTYFGRAAVPLPHPTALAGSFFYYIALPQDYDAAAQAVLWVLGFPAAGWLLLGCLAAAARAGRLWSFADLLRSHLLGLAPLLLPLPWLAWLHATGPGGVSWQQFLAACLHRSFAVTPPYLNPLFLGLAAVGLGGQLAYLRRRTERGWPAVLGWSGAAFVAGTTAATCVALALGAVLA